VESEVTSDSTPGASSGVSGIITCLNEEANIAECIESLDWCAEILVVDSFSTDRTVEIAQRYPKVRLFQRTYYGGAAQKNWAIDKARNEWIMILDADERCTPDLRREIEALLRARPKYDAYTIRRRCFFLGEPIRFSGWQNDRVTRLFRRGTAYYNNRRVHERLITAGRAPILRHRMDHHLIVDFREYVQRINRYGYWGAAQCWRDNKKAGFAKVMANPIWRFIRTYIWRLGFLDGTRGLVFCMLQAYATYLARITKEGHHDPEREERTLRPERELLHLEGNSPPESTNLRRDRPPEEDEQQAI
jgi:glycosyltransferase involved in cell wall biosynthesis